jgi:MoxR-like ATPase
MSPATVFDARRQIHEIKVSEPVERYIVALVQATRDPARLDDDLKRWIEVGVSPRGSIGLDKVARAIAWLRGRDYVTPEDVQAVVHDVFRHRLILSYDAHAAGSAPTRSSTAWCSAWRWPEAIRLRYETRYRRTRPLAGPAQDAPVQRHARRQCRYRIAGRA